MFKIIGFTLTILFVSALSSDNVNQSRRDYTYNEKSKAFYKLHDQSLPYNQAKKVCELEGGTLMLPATDDDIQQAHAFFNINPGLDEYYWVQNDGARHDAVKDSPILDLVNLAKDKDLSPCNVITERGDIVTMYCGAELTFICKIEAKYMYYDEVCLVSSKGYKYNYKSGSCYKVSDTAITWNEALEECNAHGAHLAIINSESEYYAIWKILQKAPTAYDGARFSHFFLAGFKANKRGQEEIKEFYTIFDESLDEAGYGVWSEGEPNNFENSEYCGTIYNFNGKLNDIDCAHYRYPYICEKEINKK